MLHKAFVKMHLGRSIGDPIGDIEVYRTGWISGTGPWLFLAKFVVLNKLTKY